MALSRRKFLTTGAAATGAAAMLPLLPSSAASPSIRPRRLTGTVRDVKHVVVLMQENRSFDHYYGALGGVRGYDDKQQLRYPTGGTILRPT